MNCEIEFLPVGESSQAGDAIVIRYGTDADYKLMVIDGGTKESGAATVEHVRRQFGTKSIISHVVVTHPDADHASGVRSILSELPVENLWLHVPWLHAAKALPYFADKRWTADGLTQAIRKQYGIIDEIVGMASAQSTSVYEPFAGAAIGPLMVLSPTQRIYELLLPQFDGTPDADRTAIEATGCWIGKEPGTVAQLFEKLAAKVQKKWIHETWEKELLREGGVTSATNESSVILYGQFNEGPVLLTGDAGLFALTRAAESAETANLPLQRFAFVQIPHHGSRRNVGPTILNRLLGPIQPVETPGTMSAFVSAPKNDDTHPREMVLNAFRRRRGRVLATQGNSKVCWGGFQPRQGYSPAEASPFAAVVEDYDD